MIKSMTGFGRFEISDDVKKIIVELKSVNHRYLDLNIKMPRKFNCFEADIRRTLKEYIERGKVDVFITYEDLAEKNVKVKYNSVIAAEYVNYIKEMAEEFDIENDLRASSLSRYPDVLTMEDVSELDEELWIPLEQTIRGACEKFVDARKREGDSLKKDLVEKLELMLDQVDEIEKRAPEIVAEYRQKLNDKVAELLGNNQIDENRLSTEIVLFADKICTDEETVRLRNHINTTIDILNSADGVGRKLDFIAQEMNREANTILSKANDLDTSAIAIEIKTGIEKVREQIQNIE